jgi:exopolyphosphatase / guanosine-5'-triphosphate,3'-diphosphate pyrophosphatase
MKVAAVDIGTNTVRLLLGAVEDGSLDTGWRRTEITRLGRGVDQNRQFDPEARSLTLGVLAEYRRAADAYGAERRAAFATSATRDADDREEFLTLASDAFGARPEVISGEREAEFSFSGVRSSLQTTGAILVIDLGGGSTEFVYGVSAVEYSKSIDIGSVRVTERWLSAGPVTNEQLEEVRAEVAAELSPLAIPGAPAVVVGVAGTFTTLASVHLGLDVYDPDVVHGTALRLSDLLRLVERLAAMSVEEIAQIPTVPAGRADVLLGGAIVAQAALARVGAAQITVSAADLLDGMALAIAAG